MPGGRAQLIAQAVEFVGAILLCGGLVALPRAEVVAEPEPELAKLSAGKLEVGGEQVPFRTESSASRTGCASLDTERRAGLFWGCTTVGDQHSDCGLWFAGTMGSAWRLGEDAGMANPAALTGPSAVHLDALWGQDSVLVVRPTAVAATADPREGALLVSVDGVRRRPNWEEMRLWALSRARLVRVGSQSVCSSVFLGVAVQAVAERLDQQQCMEIQSLANIQFECGD